MAKHEQVELSDAEKRDLTERILAGKHLPERYRFLLFEDKNEVELVWNGKNRDVCNTVLPFQVLEHIDEPRKEKKADEELDFDVRGRQKGGWTNKLIWGDNKLILSSLRGGPLRREIEEAGGLKLIYIDPPFDVGADFSMDIEIGGETFHKEANVLEQIAYRDTWGRGADSFVNMIYERIQLMRDLMHPEGSIFVHCDWRVTAYLRLVLDEIFGKDCIRNEIIWTYTGPGSPGMSQYNRKHNTVFWFSKSCDKWTFEDTEVRVPHDDKTAGNFKTGLEGSGFKSDTYKLPEGKIPESWWEMAIAQRFPVDGIKRVGYPTEKPWALIERIVKGCSHKGDLVADFFCGGGIVPAVCEVLGRKWIGADLGKFAIHATRKRMIQVQRVLKKDGKSFSAFEVLNLGKYQRHAYINISHKLSGKAKEKALALKEKEFRELILKAYKSQPLLNDEFFHGKTGNRVVVVGPVNLPVTRLFVEEVVNQCRQRGVTRCDLLAFEYELGLFPAALEEAKQKGIDLMTKKIPPDVFDKRVVEAGEVEFHEVSYIEATPRFDKKDPHKVAVELTDFSVFHQQGQFKKAAEELKEGKSTVICDKGKLLKITKNKDGRIEKEILTKTWHDWIDYWAVDFDYESRKEIIKRTKGFGAKGEQDVFIPEPGSLVEYEEVWSGNYIFENEWQSFRTKKDRELELTSAWHTYKKPGKHIIAVKVVDIFGNDTMTLVPINVS